MTAHSLLFPQPSAFSDNPPPAFFDDLGLTQLLQVVLPQPAQRDLLPLFYCPLTSREEIGYRQDILREMEIPALQQALRRFQQRMEQVRFAFETSGRLEIPIYRAGWLLETALRYIQTVLDLQQSLTGLNLRSTGLKGFLAWLKIYSQSASFAELRQQAQIVRAGLDTARYTVILQGNRVSVRKAESEEPYTLQVQTLFQKFKQEENKDYRLAHTDSGRLNLVEIRILELVARLYPQAFGALQAFASRFGSFLDETLLACERDLRFYLAWLDFLDSFSHKDLPFCYPQINEDRQLQVEQGFDLALAARLRYSDTPLITNNFELRGQERIFVVTGPNQGGKTTFARAVGQLHYLARLGLKTPGSSVSLPLVDQIFTHFEREEDIRNQSGKLQDDLRRVHAIFDQATPRSLVIFNEIFSSTTFKDALFLSREMMTRLQALDCLSVWVTFLDELASFGPKTVSLVSLVETDAAENSARRTFQLQRQPANGLAYALSLAEKHGLTRAQIQKRMRS